MRVFIIIVIVIVLMIIIGTIILKPSSTPVRKSWKQEYLDMVYPLAKGKLTDSDFDSLEFYYTHLIPEKVIEEWSVDSYKAEIPGPSCQQLPCPCKDGFPDVTFDQDPLWKRKWPICTSIYGLTGIKKGEIQDGIPPRDLPPCCDTVQNFKKCLMYMRELPDNFDLWDAPNIPDKYNPPKMGQLWKPTLHPPFTAVKSKFPPENWNKFYNIEGDGHRTWVEVVHAYFPGESGGQIGTWFYRAKGSGMFLNLGETISSKNKIDFMVKIWGIPRVANYIFQKAKDITFWRGNCSAVLLSEFFKNVRDKLQVNIDEGDTEQTIDRKKYQRLIEIIVEPFKEKGMDPYIVYEICRIPNSGNMDDLLIEGLSQLSVIYRTLQFTAQPNLYPGWTTEILYRGDRGGETISDAYMIPKDQLRIIDPTMLKDNNSSNQDIIDSSRDCMFSDQFRFLYCNGLKSQDGYVNMNNPDNLSVRNWVGFRECIVGS